VQQNMGQRHKRGPMMQPRLGGVDDGTTQTRWFTLRNCLRATIVRVATVAHSSFPRAQSVAL
jgi:hypothetical protein